MRIKRGHANGCCLRCLCTTIVCASELNVLLVYPACSKIKFYASKADCRTSARSLFPSARTLLSLRSARGWKELRFQLKHWYVASLILHISITEITAQLLSSSYSVAYLIFIRRRHDYIFLCRLTSRKGELVSLNGSRFSHYFIFIPLSDNKQSNVSMKTVLRILLHQNTVCGTERQTNVIINNKCTFCMFRSELPCHAKMQTGLCKVLSAKKEK